MKYKYSQKSIIGLQSTALAIILSAFGFYLIFREQYISGLIFIAISVPLFLLKKYIQFDPENRFIFSYYYFLGVPLGRKKKIREMKGIKVLKVSKSQNVNSRVSSNQIKESGYGAMLFYDDDKIMLKFDQDKTALEKEMREICVSHALKINVK